MPSLGTPQSAKYITLDLILDLNRFPVLMIGFHLLAETPVSEPHKTHITQPTAFLPMRSLFYETDNKVLGPS
jgi:hypothetical protein